MSAIADRNIYFLVAPPTAQNLWRALLEYRALDVRLRREVAIKVLPGLASSDPERLWRFEQEAMAAAALDSGGAALEPGR